jgi:hypothetical protein
VRASAAPAAGGSRPPTPMAKGPRGRLAAQDFNPVSAVNRRRDWLSCVCSGMTTAGHRRECRSNRHLRRTHQTTPDASASSMARARSASRSSPKPLSGATSRPARARPTSFRCGNSVSRSASSERCCSSLSIGSYSRSAGSGSSSASSCSKLSGVEPKEPPPYGRSGGEYPSSSTSSTPRSTRVSSGRLVVYSSEHDGLDPFSAQGVEAILSSKHSELRDRHAPTFQVEVAMSGGRHAGEAAGAWR